MKRFLTCIFFTCILCSLSLAKQVEGRVHFSNRPVSGVIVTDGEAFTRTNAEGAFRMEVRDNTEFIYIVPPYGFTTTASEGGYPIYWQEADGRTWFSFELVPSSPATDYTLFAITSLQISDPQQFDDFKSTFIPDLSDISIKARIKGLTAAVVRTEGIGPEYLPKVKKLLASAKIQMHFTGDGPADKAMFMGKDLIVFSRNNDNATQAFVQKLSGMLQEDTYVLYPESFSSKWQYAPQGFKVYSRTGEKFSWNYHRSVNEEYPDKQMARLNLFGSTVQNIEKEALEAVCSGVEYIEAKLQLSRSGKVILLQDNYPKYAASASLEAEEFIDMVEAFTKDCGLPQQRYAFAINSGSGAGEGKVWPEYKEFADKCLSLLAAKGLEGRLLIESFDDRVLNYIHAKYPDAELCYLVDTECGSYQDFMSLLDFVPGWIGFQKEMFNEELAGLAREAGMRFFVWED